MIITPSHARRAVPAPAELALWALWLAARYSGVGLLLETVRTSRPADWSRRFRRAVASATSRATIRTQLAAAAFLVGPAADAIGTARARFDRNAPQLAFVVLFFVSLIPSAIQ